MRGAVKGFRAPNVLREGVTKSAVAVFDAAAIEIVVWLGGAAMRAGDWNGTVAAGAATDIMTGVETDARGATSFGSSAPSSEGDDEKS